MTDDVWYYSLEGARQGPISVDQLQDLLVNAQLTAEDLVWRSGMDSWQPIREVDGLSGYAPPVPPPLHGAGGYSSSPRGGKSFFESMADRASRLQGSDSIADHLPHVRLMGSLVGGLERLFTVSLLEKVDKAARNTGHLLYAVAAALFILFYIILAIKSDSFQVLVDAFLVLPVAFVGHYVAVRAFETTDKLNLKSPSRLFSNVLLQCSGLMALFAGLFFVFGGFYSLIKENDWPGFWIMLGLGIIFTYLCGLLLNPTALDVRIDETVGPAEEALEIWTFFTKLLVRLTSVVFCVGTIAGVGAAIYFISVLFRDGLLSASFPIFAGMTVTDMVMRALAIGLVPLLAYMAFIFSFLFVSILRAILGIPAGFESLQKHVEKG